MNTKLFFLFIIRAPEKYTRTTKLIFSQWHNSIGVKFNNRSGNFLNRSRMQWPVPGGRRLDVTFFPPSLPLTLVRTTFENLSVHKFYLEIIRFNQVANKKQKNKKKALIYSLENGFLSPYFNFSGSD